jgi:hypothetical protein
MITSMNADDPRHLVISNSWSCHSRTAKRHVLRPREIFSDFAIKRVTKQQRWSPRIHLLSDTSATTTLKQISWLGYHAMEWCFSQRYESDDMFNGVIHYIHANSGFQYNRSELTLEYSSCALGSDPTAILDPMSNNCFESGPSPFECFAVTFHRVSVRPFALTIQAGQWTRKNSPQWCFVFQGWHPKSKKWVVLTERANEFRPWNNWKGYAIDTEFAFRKFRFLYTGPVTPGVPSFSLKAFEIHGTVFPDEIE